MRHSGTPPPGPGGLADSALAVGKQEQAIAEEQTIPDWQVGEYGGLSGMTLLYNRQKGDDKPTDTTTRTPALDRSTRTAPLL